MPIRKARTSRVTATRCLILLCLALVVVSARAHADDTPYRLYPAQDATALGVSAVVWFGPALFRLNLVAADGCECNRASVNGFDRWVAGTYRPGVSIAGDILVGTVYSLAVLLDLLNVVQADEPVTSFLTDLVVMGEALLVNGAINQVAKLATARPRPLLYERALSDPLQHDADSYVSFYSSHTSSAFAVALAYAQTFAYRNPDSPYRFVAYAAAVAAGGGVGATRIAAGKHFPSDVLVGAAVGAAMGIFIPWLHRHSSRAQLSVTLAPGNVGLALVVPER